jgi:hypothetical protein
MRERERGGKFGWKRKAAMAVREGLEGRRNSIEYLPNRQLPQRGRCYWKSGSTHLMKPFWGGFSTGRYMVIPVPQCKD